MAGAGLARPSVPSPFPIRHPCVLNQRLATAPPSGRSTARSLAHPFLRGCAPACPKPCGDPLPAGGGTPDTMSRMDAFHADDETHPCTRLLACDRRASHKTDRRCDAWPCAGGVQPVPVARQLDHRQQPAAALLQPHRHLHHAAARHQGRRHRCAHKKGKERRRNTREEERAGSLVLPATTLPAESGRGGAPVRRLEAATAGGSSRSQPGRMRGCRSRGGPTRTPGVSVA